MFLFDFLYRLAFDKRTLEPRRVLFFLLYYGIGAFVAFIVATTVLLCMEVYDLTFARNFIYGRLGENVLTALESLLF
ncbi:MAG TPA: hypothetical protein VK465_02680 [Fibrobacteria bacterium]|nr:hypothetical protein [Fibrobacteria bacterium]